ncbi:MAG: FtsX-like permease family protein [Bdellovibrionaceae bacterium]|nr:FtsX-like permease family protein [Pseudobdellovibrionaceae bacterium]
MFLYFFRRLIFSARAGSLVKRIAVLSFFGIAIALSAFILVLSVMNGMNANIRKRISAVEPHLVLAHRTLEVDQLASDLRSEIEAVETFEERDLVARAATGPFRSVMAVGLNSEAANRLHHRIMQQIYGETFVPPLDLEEGEVVLGAGLANVLEVIEGDELALFSPEALLTAVDQAPPLIGLRVKRILLTHVADIDNELFIYRQTKQMSGISRNPQNIGVRIWLKDPFNAERVKGRLQQIGVTEVQTWAERNAVMFFALKLEKIMIGVFLGLAALVAGFSILTVLTLLISEKRRDIAVLQVLGMPRGGVLKLFTRIGFLLGLSSTSVGIVLGTLLSAYIQQYPLQILPAYYIDREIPAQVEPTFILATAVVTLLLTFFGAWIPARAVTKINLQTALRVRN